MTVASPEESRYMARELPESELLPTIIEEANFSDNKIRKLEGLLLLNEELDAGQRACFALTLGRCGWGRSEGALRQLGSSLIKNGHFVEAQAVRLAIQLLAHEPDPKKVERGEEGYQFREPGEPVLFVEDPVAAHWHRQDRWGPPIRPARHLPEKSLSEFSTPAHAIDAAMNGEIVSVTGRKERWLVTRAWLWSPSSDAPPFRWTRVRSMGRHGKSGNSAGVLAFESEGAGVRVIEINSEDQQSGESFLFGMYKRVRELPRDA